MTMPTTKPSKIQKLLEALNDASSDLLEITRETAKGEHPGQWPAFGSIIDVRQVLADQLRAVADVKTKLKKAIGRESGPANLELLRISRNIFWFVSNLEVVALPAILDADLNDKKTRDHWAEKLSVEPEWSDILIKLSMPVRDPERSENEELQAKQDSEWQHKLTTRAQEIDAKLDDLAGRVDAEHNTIVTGFKQEAKNDSMPQTVYRHDKNSFSLDRVNQFSVPVSIGDILCPYGQLPSCTPHNKAHMLLRCLSG